MPKKQFIATKVLTNIPEDTLEAVVKTIETLGPCTWKELKQLLGYRRMYRFDWQKAVDEGHLLLLNEKPRAFDLPKFQNPLTGS